VNRNQVENTSTRGNNMPVIPQPTGVYARSRRRLSASSLVTWERCRRDWFLTRRLGIQSAKHPEMILGIIIEEAVTSIWMERPHPTEGMPEGASSWAPGKSGEQINITDIDELEIWLRTLMSPVVDKILEILVNEWDDCKWKAEGRSINDIKREKLNSMVKNAIKLQISETRDCLENNGGPHLEEYRDRGDPFGTPAPFWGEGKGTGWQTKGEKCTWWEAWEIARPWFKDPRINAAQRLFHPDGWAAGELDVAHRWRGEIHIVDIKANRGHQRDHTGVAHQLRFYQWLWNETRKHPGKPVNSVDEGVVTEAKSWHLADGFVHKADLIEDIESETKRLKEIQEDMSRSSWNDFGLEKESPSIEGLLGCEKCHGPNTCDYPRGGLEQPLHSLIPKEDIDPPESPFSPISSLPSRVSVRGNLHGHWGPMPNHFGDPVIGAAITAGEKSAVIEEMGINQFPSLHQNNGDVVIRNAAPGQWRGMIRLYLDKESEILPAELVDGKLDRIGLIPTRANVSGIVISCGKNKGVNAKGREWSMSTIHLWDGTGIIEVVAFGIGRTESFDQLEVGNNVKFMAAEMGWREGTPQLRIDPRNTRMSTE